jgi:hypothetical protein
MELTNNHQIVSFKGQSLEEQQEMSRDSLDCKTSRKTFLFPCMFYNHME